MAQFVGIPCGHHSSYTFYKAFKYRKKGRYKILTLGQFFFIQISEHHPVCVAELQLLWEDTQSKEKLSSSKLYFLPESTPNGRLNNHGQDELLAVSGKVILKLDDLVNWITWDVTWHKGIVADDVIAEDPVNRLTKVFADNNRSLNVNDVKQEKELIGDMDDDACPSVTILSFPGYCRFRASMRRLEGHPKSWMNDGLIVSLLGGAAAVQKGRRMYVMFCRDLFDYPELFENERCCHQLAPSLKGRPRKKKTRSKRSLSPSSESNDSVESKTSGGSRTKRIEVNGLKRRKIDLEGKSQKEQEFYKNLFRFMDERNTPIDRIPSLGFKQIDLYFFYSYSKKLGGYDKICEKRLWKHIYDELGGSQGSTSAATCTRRHYERLILPYEIQLRKERKSLMNSSIRPRRIRDKSEDKPKTEFQTKEQIKVETVDEDIENKDLPLLEKESAPTVSETVTNDRVEQIEVVENISSTPPPAVVKTTVVTSSHSDDKKRRNDDVAPECVVIKKLKENPVIDKEKKWEEIRKKNALARGKNPSSAILPTRVQKKTVLSNQQRTSGCLPHNRLVNECTNHLVRSTATLERSSSSPPCKSSPVSPVIHKATSHPIISTSTMNNLSSIRHHLPPTHSNSKPNPSLSSAWKAISPSRLPSPSSLPLPGKLSSAIPDVEKISINKNRPVSAHQGTTVKRLEIQNRLSGLCDKNKSNNLKPAHQSTYCVSNNVARDKNCQDSLILDLSINGRVNTGVSSIEPINFVKKEKLKHDIDVILNQDKELDLSVKPKSYRNDCNKSSVLPSKSKVAFSPLMSLSTMSAKLMETASANNKTVKVEPKTMKVQPIVNNSVSYHRSHQASSSRSRIDSRSPVASENSRYIKSHRPVFTVSPQVTSTSRSNDSININAARSNHNLVAPIPLSAANPFIPSSYISHYGYPQFPALPYMFPPGGHMLPNSKSPFVQIPTTTSVPNLDQLPAMCYPPQSSLYGLPPLPAQLMMSPEHFQASLESYKNMVQRGMFPGMHHGYPGMVQSTAQMLATQNHLRQEPFSPSNMNKP